MVQALVDEEAETTEQSADDFLERKFGRDEVAAANAQAVAIAQASGMKGVSVPLPDPTEPSDHPVVQPSGSPMIEQPRHHVSARPDVSGSLQVCLDRGRPSEGGRLGHRREASRGATPPGAATAGHPI